eukprot:g521.t1
MDDLLPERLLFLADAPTCAALLRCSWRFAVVGRRAKERLQQGLVTEVTDSFRFYELHITVVRPKLPNGDLHGLEKGGCIPYRVGGPGEASFYSERWWCEGHLLSDCFWETNSWKYFARYEMHELLGLGGCPIISGDCSTQPGDIQTRETNLFSLLLLELRTPMECCVYGDALVRLGKQKKCGAWAHFTRASRRQCAQNGLSRDLSDRLLEAVRTFLGLDEMPEERAEQGKIPPRLLPAGQSPSDGFHERTLEALARAGSAEDEHRRQKFLQGMSHTLHQHAERLVQMTEAFLETDSSLSTSWSHVEHAVDSLDQGLVAATAAVLGVLLVARGFALMKPTFVLGTALALGGRTLSLAMAGLGRSASSGALVNAGAAQMTHVPKRATQHALFLASWEVAPPCLKPGQATAGSRAVYSEEAPDPKTTYVAERLPPKSMYGDSLSFSSTSGRTEVGRCAG